jgi:dTDP-4-dehydrorhamnose reductase
MSDRPTLVAGASGLVGGHLARVFAASGRASGPVVATANEQSGGDLVALDMRDHDAVRAFVAGIRPALVLCPAAVSNVERCELEPEATRAINVDGTLALAEAAAEAGATFVFFSSEYVFDGTDGPYDEQREVSPINEYGRQKAEVEQALPALTGGDFMVARVSCVYGHERRRKNFVFQLWAALSEGREFRTPGDQIGTPTAAANAAEVVRDLVDAGERGVFHVAGAERMLRSDLARIAAEELGLDPGLIRPVETSELGLAAPRPLGAGLLVDRASAVARTPLLGPRAGIRQMLAQAPIAVSA